MNDKDDPGLPPKSSHRSSDGRSGCQVGLAVTEASMNTPEVEKKLAMRTWHYIYPPDFYECCCENDERMAKDASWDAVSTHKVTWSEYAGMLWCFKCEKDTKGFGGIFDGPIPFEATKMILGPDCFDRWDIKKREVQTCCVGRNGNMYWKRDKIRTACARRNPPEKEK